MSSQAFLKPCCKQGQNRSMHYADLVASDDHQLRAFSNLIFCVNDLEMFNIDTLHEISHFIDAYLDRKLVREHFMFGRSIKKAPISDVDLGAELHRVHAQLRELGVI